MAQSVRVGFLSRIDYGSPGFRKGLLELAFDRFREARVHFIVLAGGLISGKAMKHQVPRKKDERDAFYQKIASELAEALPRMGKDDEVKMYVMVSPAYDGPAGEPIARHLAELRKDIRFYAKHSERFGKGCKKVAVLVPTKVAWRADYASVPVDRLLRDELKRSTQPPADVYMVGCFGVFVHRPKGESPCTYSSVPALHKLEDVSVAENQVGVVVLDANDEIRVTNISFKDMVRDERRLISVPAGLSDVERRVFERLQEGPQTVGMIEDALQVDRDKVVKSLEKLAGMERRNYPSIFLDENSGRYDFDCEWMQKELRYPWNLEDVREDRGVACGCVHCGSVHTDYEFLVNTLPQILVATDATFFAIVGDLIEGLKHELMLRGEVIPGMNYTDHEQFAGEAIATVLGKTFALFVEREVKKGRPETVSKVEQLMQQCLVACLYTEGNHDQWVQPLGFNPLAMFRVTLVAKLAAYVENVLREHRLPVPPQLQVLVEKKIIATDQSSNVYALPSGVSVGFRHPHQGRAQTTTLRLQSALAAMKGCQAGLIANFHTAAAMTQWDPILGQRVGMQLGTLKRRSDFEDKMNKVIDFGVGVLRMRSRNGRLVETQTVFLGEPRGEKITSDRFIREFKKQLGIGQ